MGFGGCIDSTDELIPKGARVLRLPEGGIVDGPFVRVPEREFDCILVEGLTESLGRAESFCAAAARRLAPGGTLILDVEHLAAPRSLKFLLEGQPGNFDPSGSIAEPELRLHRRRALAAMAAAGLTLREVYAVPSRPDAIGPEFVRTIFREGFLPLPYLGGLPPARLWIEAVRRQPKAGTVLIGAGPADAQERTRTCLNAFLPADWEVVACDPEAPSEQAAFDTAVAETHGTTFWLLRAGALVDQQLFEGLWARTPISPAAPGTPGADLDAHALDAPGDLSGLMLSRLDLFTVGPIAAEFQSTAISYEDWLLRLEANCKRIHPVRGRLDNVPLPQREGEPLTTEAEALLAKWRPVERDESGLRSNDNPWCRAHTDRPVPWAGRTPRLSLCMIVRNEQRFLDRCLTSVRGVVDEIVVVDTGSTDDTVAIAQRHGARLIHHAWSHDFAAARNVALEAATGDWILSLDADEALRSEQHDELRELLEDPGIAGYHLKFENHHTGAQSAGVIMVRLFRNLEGITWENRIHEQITASLLRAGQQHGLQLSTSEVMVDHYGYLDEVMSSRDKNTRNDRLFRMHLEEHPDDIYMLYKYGDFLRRCQDCYEQSRECLARAFELLCARPPADRAEVPYAAEIAALYALECRRIGDLERANHVIRFALREFVGTPNLHYLAAGLALLAKQPDVAIRHYERCLAFRDRVLVVPIQEGVTSYVSLTGIAHAHLLKGELVEADRLLRQSSRLAPDHEVTVLLRSRVLLERGDLAAALRLLLQHLERHPEATGVCQQAVLILEHTGHSADAASLAAKAEKLVAMQRPKPRTETSDRPVLAPVQCATS
ncbi:MAG: glycosyltransferase [Planctomycetes bacterium]|nr:glycosyltransferase [Planctomycetota bacterium]